MPLRLGTEMPSIEGATEWLNTQSRPQLADNQVTLIHFWAVSCHICHETMDDLMRMVEKYTPQGLQVIAFHLPRIAEDANVQKVKEDISQFHLTQPVGLDHARAVADRFENEYVPAFFIFGKDGKLKFRAAGDKGFQKVESKIQEALAQE
ncbi:TlpA disulfide reductase family protein [Alicyclobacillus tolerans]|uniref:AhpC/TSA family protein n=1 Tax=Alicyclobacillus tolerans TaxID=90970 RepID=A0A1M6U364_9BACL|nr:MULTISPECIES: TlpA disulfide reductase family protein [Alicyclobacillus]QRF24254.1 TlpA family protein disulfide reductase [Alicyclobacillus sp. TC]SHK63518.1 AhpC/TSA family protein [Alicyclobacillus montanus]